MSTNLLEDNVTVDGQSILITATLVSEGQRMRFLPELFGDGIHMLTGEAMVYDNLSSLSPDYRGGYWNFYNLSNGGQYMAPATDCDKLRIRCEGNFYDGEISPDAAGIVATLYALNALLWKTGDEALLDKFELLRDYAGDHAEGPQIFRAID